MSQHQGVATFAILTTGRRMEDADEVYQVLRETKVLARRYYQLTGKPLGVTGEIAEYEAARHLNVELELARQAGYDATEVRDGCLLYTSPSPRDS